MKGVPILAILLLTVTSCCAQSDESKVEAVLKQMERAEQTGDFNAWAQLSVREKSGEVEKMRSSVRPRPEAKYRATKTFVRGDQAVVLAQDASNSFVTMTLRRESGQWKIRDQVWRDTAPDANSFYALLPPDPGAFARAGSPWDRVTPAMDPKQATRLGWHLKAVFDESYRYPR